MLVGGIGGVCAMGSAVLCSCGAGSHREQFVCLSARLSACLCLLAMEHQVPKPSAVSHAAT